jgi:hypothetical protein
MAHRPMPFSCVLLADQGDHPLRLRSFLHHRGTDETQHFRVGVQREDAVHIGLFEVPEDEA